MFALLLPASLLALASSELASTTTEPRPNIVLIVADDMGVDLVSAYREAGISTVIWANHNMRAAAAAMFALCERVQRDESVAGVEQEIAPLDSIFGRLNYAELSEAERRYLPARSE